VVAQIPQITSVDPGKPGTSSGSHPVATLPTLLRVPGFEFVSTNKEKKG
jgi:hypothetical protein